MTYDIFGIGSAIMDFLIQIEHNELVEFNLKKGQFHLIDEEHSKKLLKEIESHKVITAPGGSSANTVYGAAILGSNVVFCGKVGKDKHGDIYEQKMQGPTMKPILARSDKMTGHSITFITPDTERTFAVHLGAAMQLKKEDVFFEDLKQSKILHIEGYQLEDKQLREVSLHAMKFAKENGVKVSIDVGDPGIAKRNREDITQMIREYADIVFMNEDEAKSLTDLEPLEALNIISKLADITIVKVGKDGSYIKQGDTIHQIPSYSAKAIDTTGCGDMYAAGVLHGIAKGHSLKVSGHIGSFYASKVVEKIGARLDGIDQIELNKFVNDIK